MQPRGFCSVLLASNGNASNAGYPLWPFPIIVSSTWFLPFLRQSAGEWKVVFYLGGVIYAFGALFFVLFSSGNKQSWAQDYSELLVDDGEPSEQ